MLWIACTPDEIKSPKKLPDLPSNFTASIDGQLTSDWSTTKPSETQLRGEWWRVFNDETLNKLCEKSKINNANIHLSQARLLQSRATLAKDDSNLYPNINLIGSASKQGGPLINAAGGSGSLYTGALHVSYEMDLYNRLSDGLNISKLNAESQEALLKNTELLVQADVTQTYFSLRMLDDERLLLRKQISSYKKSLALTKKSFSLGSVSELDVVRLESELATIESELLELDRKRTELVHQLATLVGDVPTNFSLTESFIPWKVVSIPVGLPSTLLSRRPDISAAQRNVMAAQLKLGISQRAWLPSITLNTAIGTASPKIIDLMSMSMRAWTFGLLFGMPLFDGGERKANILNSNAEVEIATANYREKILIAFKEVEDSISSIFYLSEQVKSQKKALDLSAKASLLSESRYSSGLISQLEVLDTKRSELKNRRAMIQLQATQTLLTVSMIRALGGGWETPMGTEK